MRTVSWEGKERNMSLSELKKLKERLQQMEEKEAHLQKDIELLKQIFVQIRDKFDFIKMDITSKSHHKHK